jgi:ribosomal protein S18 acetylase RimI-like enzyme
MSTEDLERVLEIARSLRQAPQWPASAYAAAMNPGNTPRRIALVAECNLSEDPDLYEGIEGQTAGAKAHVDRVGIVRGLKPPPPSVLSLSAAWNAAPFQDGGPVCGFLVAVLLAPEAELETIAVAENEQRRGVGGFLLRALTEVLRTEEVSDLILELRFSNRTALGFHKAQGFEETGRRPRYYADPEEDAVLMRLKLA